MQLLNVYSCVIMHKPFFILHNFSFYVNAFPKMELKPIACFNVDDLDAMKKLLRALFKKNQST